MTLGGVTVCVPVWNAEAFLAETLDRIAGQSHADIRVLLSLDPGADGSEAICRRHLADPRFRLVVQPERLGWVGNVNFLIAAVETEFFCITPHDDLLDRHYVRELLALLAGDPAASTAYSDMATFGDDHFHVVQPEVRGGRLRRLLDVLLNHNDAVAFRGLVRRRSPQDRPFLPTGLVGDFAADTVWLADLAARGELRRLPGGLYRKRLHGGSAHAAWERWPTERRHAAWIDQAVRLARSAAGWLDDPEERALAAMGAAMRLAGLGAAVRPPVLAAPMFRVHEVAAFAARIHPLAVPDDLSAALDDPRAAPIVAARLLAGARQHAAAGETERASGLVARALATDPLAGHAAAERTKLLIDAGRARLLAGDMTAARAAIGDALAVDPDDYHANLLQAELHIADGETTRALAVLQRLDALWPRTAPVAQRLRLLRSGPAIDAGGPTAPP